MSDIVYRGLTTSRLYRFAFSSLPATLGGVTGTFNGEPVVLVNRDGSMERGNKGGNLTDPYSVGNAPSAWEKA